MNLKKTIKVIFFLLCLMSLTVLNLFAQKKDTSDYFAIGLYGGAFIGQGPFHGQNEFINSVAAEVEYFKLENLSFYLQGLYEFSGSDFRRPPPVPAGLPENKFHGTDSYMLNFSFGGRYYLRNKTVNPFFQLGINHGTNHTDGHHYRPELLDFGDRNFRGGNSYYNISVNPGLGLNFKLSDKFNAEIKYDLYIGIISSGNEFTVYSILGGLKYNL